MEDKWKSNKEEHLKLSAAAAEKYDELYEKANFATGSYMRYEIETVKRFISQAPSNCIALDLENNCVRKNSGGTCTKFMNAKYVTLWAQTWLFDIAIEHGL